MFPPASRDMLAEWYVNVSASFNNKAQEPIALGSKKNTIN